MSEEKRTTTERLIGVNGTFSQGCGEDEGEKTESEKTDPGKLRSRSAMSYLEELKGGQQ